MAKRPLYVPHAGPLLLETPLLNKGSAFTERERRYFNLTGLLPHIIETIDEQRQRSYQQLCAFNSDIGKHVFLRNIQDTNETLFYRVVVDHIEEVMPLIYTPTVGEACQQFSRIYRRSRGLFISYPDIEDLDDMLQNATKQNVKVAVVTDGERILGLGDQGIGGMGIPIGKLSLYVACGGISPAYTLPVVLDAGCNNEELINDPLYMGWRHPRVTGAEYDEFVERFIVALKRRWPNVLLQFEDFAQANALPLLKRYRDRLCCFNDDIQGTAAVTVGTLMAASRAKQEQLRDQRVAFVGAGSAGCGIAEQIVAQTQAEGLGEAQARSRIFMVDRDGLLVQGNPGMVDFQVPLAQSTDNLQGWLFDGQQIDLIDVVENAHPTVLIGVSGKPGLFTEEVIRSMKDHCERPIVLPLSNPTSCMEAAPIDVFNWTGGQAIVATGSPCEPVVLDEVTHPIAQCNNSYIFPGIGLGAIASRATRITDNMLMTSSRVLADSSPLATEGSGPLLPPLSQSRSLSKIIAKAVFLQAVADGVATNLPEEAINAAIERNFWEPAYREFRRVSF